MRTNLKMVQKLPRNLKDIPPDGAGIHFGCNISRVFTVNEPKKRNG